MAQNVRYRNAICNLLQGDFLWGKNDCAFVVFLCWRFVFFGVCVWEVLKTSLLCPFVKSFPVKP